MNTNNLFARRAPLLNTVDNDFINNYNKFYWIAMNSISKRGFYKWSDGTPTQFTRWTQVTSDGKPLNPDIYLQGRRVVMNSIYTTSTTNIIVNRDNAGLWYKQNCNSVYGFFYSGFARNE
jgi:hypothetical protein